MTTEKTAATQYLEQVASRGEIVDVTVPSGFVFKFHKPNTLGIVLSGELPQSAASAAAEEWEKAGIYKTAVGDETEQLQVKVAEKMFEIRDRTVQLSYSPKLVIGKANIENDELSTADIPDDDLEYLFKWVAAGGHKSVMLAMFPQGREQSVMAGIGGKKRGTKTKRNGRH